MSGDKAAVPANHGVGFHDQEDLGQSAAVECAGEHCEERPVGLAELRPGDLSLQDGDVVAESKDLRISFVAGREDPPTGTG